MEKKYSLMNRFELVSSNSLNNVTQIEEIITIKEKILKKEEDEFIFRSVIELYQRIIEILSIQNDNNFQIYMDKLHKIIEKYNGFSKNDFSNKFRNNKERFDNEKEIINNEK
jgi:hypothetical protein